MAESLDILIGDHLVGVLELGPGAELRFTYDAAWLDRPEATPLSLSMPLRPGSFDHATVHPYLWGLLPDNEAVIERWARTYQCSASNVFALLANVGADVAGAAQYLRPGSVVEEAAPVTYERLGDDDVAGLLREVRQDATAWHPGRDQGRWSLAGAQAKIALAHDAERGWSIPHGRAPTTHILKPAIRHLDDHDLNELLCIRAASELGLVTESASLGHFGDERALVLTRYDRTIVDGQIVRLHQEDFCQALGVHPSRKYENEGGPTVSQMVSVLRDHSTSELTDVRRLVEAVAFNWLILGSDAHAKNYSLLLSSRRVRLAPLYDLGSMAPYADFAAKVKLSHKVGGTYRAGAIGEAHWRRFASAVGVDADELLTWIADVAGRLPGALETVVDALDLVGDERSAAVHQVAAITRWVTLAALSVGGPARTRSKVSTPPRSVERHPAGTPRGGRFAARSPGAATTDDDLA